MPSERFTEELVLSEIGVKLGKNGHVTVIEQGNVEGIAKLDALLQKAGGKPDECELDNMQATSPGKAKPEFIFAFDNKPNTIIVIECKKTGRNHESERRNKPKSFAVDGVLYYAKFLKQEYNVIAVAVSGTKKENWKISTFDWRKGQTQPVELPKGKDVLYSPENYLRLVSGEAIQKKSTRRDFMKDFVKGLSAITVASGAVGTTDMAQATNFTQRQEDTIQRRMRELQERDGRPVGSGLRTSELQLVEEAVQRISPTLIGRNVMISPRWLMVEVAPNQLMTPELLKPFRDSLDHISDVYGEFVDLELIDGRKIVVDLLSGTRFTTSANSVRVAGTGGGNGIEINKDHVGFRRWVLPGIVNHSNYWDPVVMHELGHCFASGQKFTGCSEDIVDLLVSHAVETVPGARIGIPGGSGIWEPVAGSQYRRRFINNMRTAATQNRLPIFSHTGLAHSVYKYLLLILVEDIGWGPYEEAFRSYHDESYNHKWAYIDNTPPTVNARARNTGRWRVRAREFFDRLAHFSGNENLISRHPVVGAMFEQHFGNEHLTVNSRTESSIPTAVVTSVQNPSVGPISAASRLRNCP